MQRSVCQLLSEVVHVHKTGAETFEELVADEDGMVGLEQWVSFIRGFEASKGERAARFLLRRLETGLDESAAAESVRSRVSWSPVLSL